MNLCSSGHDEICFEGHGCPMCKLIEGHEGEIDTEKDEIGKLSNKIIGLEEDIEKLTDENIELKEREANRG